MNSRALAADYDGTLATAGRLEDSTIVALERLRRSGRKLIMVTGRELDDLINTCPRLDLFDIIVAENGAVLYDPASQSVTLLAAAAPRALAEHMRRAGVPDISVGRAIIATWRPHETAALAAIRELGLEMEIIFNKDAVMILPTGINKATGLEAALKRLHLSASQVVGIGDAENDHSFIGNCGFGVAVANAIPALKDAADLVTEGARGDGVVEIVQIMLEADRSP